MTALKNSRHEAFCRAVVRGESAAGAYANIYGATGRTAEVNGSKLLRNAAVGERITELQGTAAQRTTKTVESLVNDLDETIAFARECRNPAAMVAAINSQARLLGLMIDRSEQVVLGKPAPLPTAVIELSEAEWVRQFGSGPAPMRTVPGAKRLKADQPKPPPAITWDGSKGEILKARTITIGDDDD
ncbi:Terminase small subunit [Rhizobium laguerreae]|uniref:Terminase small subunit n=1 Tax=Rhizobium laguerreae TaxID=1076926 RepID=UPI001C9232A3|nr:Terminase small subunit [Rhizobium laguerreae]